MKKTIFKLLNPINWVRAYNFQKKNAQYSKSSYDLELFLYSKILKNDMLHYGYFEDVTIAPDTISIRKVEEAQIKYAQNIIDLVTAKDKPILDVGCGMGGLSAMLMQQGFKPEALTPNANQKEHISKKYPTLTCYKCKFEELNTTNTYGTIINSESLQYIKLDEAFALVDKHLQPGGRWIVVDYFRTSTNTINKSGHMLSDFLEKIKSNNWKIVHQQDITPNVLPTLHLVNLYVERFMLPIKHFAFEKLRFKKAWIYYLTGDIRESIDKKITKEIASIDPVMFGKEKKYILFALEKAN
ncbi:MAG: class I SAM-dependent methyltransferase [Bacteroidetes bacterium]|nr:class I SAM-dependent methyltransferase [Bacteroidota bacterium]